ncbi:MAG: putative glycoside hydrolase, partial [Gemmatimonadota bacterium]|nr:putative glycoside hydrolase [Gemmatimonadota bacterium]
GKSLLDSTAIIRALYVNRFAAQSSKKLAKLIGFADSTEVNAFVIDMKDEFGLNWNSSDPEVSRNAGAMGKLRNVRALLDTLKAHGIMPIARLVTFKDSAAARANPTETIRKNDGSPWHDRQGLTWVNPYSNRIQEYNLRAAEELVRMGFEEIQWDYIRFPEPYASLPPQVFPNTEGVSKPDAIAAFLAKARKRLNALGVRSTADVFGLTTTVTGPLEVAQHWERVAPVTDVLLPMVYPSHYPRGSLGVAYPNGEPYAIVFKALTRARERTEKLGIHGQHVRPWLQAFTLGKPPYEAEQLRQQIKAVYDSGYEGWVLWNPGSNFDVFIPALAKTLEPHARK